MRRGLLAICLVFSMVLAGCLGPSSADWGSGDGSVNVEFSMENTTVVSTLGDQPRTVEGLKPVGCTPGTEGGSLDASTGEPVRFTGYMAASQFYDAHSEGVAGLQLGVTTAVAIQSMTFAQAAAVVDGEGARIDVSDWSVPLYPETGAGSVDLDEVDSESETSWFVLGLIPTTEHVLYGMQSLNEWHQAVTVHGYLVEPADSGSGYGYKATWHNADNDCSMMVGAANREDALVLVSRITLEDAVVTSNGEANDEWVFGNVPFLGRAGFILFFLAGGFGGAVGLFVVSNRLMMKSAKSSMRTLIGEEGMKKAASVKSDAKAAKKAGMESPTQRQKRTENERKQAEKKQATERGPPKNDSPRRKKDDDALGGFDLDSVLASSSTGGSGGSGPTGRKSSVVVTDAAQEMDRMNVRESQTSSLPPSIGQQRTTSVTGSMSNVGAEEQTKPTVRRRRAVKKAKPSVEPARETTVAHHEEEEEFSDFSF